MNWKKSIDQFFQFSRSEKGGILTLLLLSLVLIWLMSFGKQIFKSDINSYHFKEFELEVSRWQESKQQEYIKEFEPRDINELSHNELIDLGLKRSLAYTLINYRSSIKGFSSISQLNQVYGMDSASLSLLTKKTFVKEKKLNLPPPKPIAGATASSGNDGMLDSIKTEKIKPAGVEPDSGIMVESKIDSSNLARPSYWKVNDIVIDVNSASIEEWQELYGIGPAYSRRIVKFRNALGGFHDVYQVSETYGLPDSVFFMILPSLSIQPETHQLISINDVDLDGLVKHPYLKFRDARILYNYVQQHKPIQDENKLYSIIGLDSIVIQKILPYLEF